MSRSNPEGLVEERLGRLINQASDGTRAEFGKIYTELYDEIKVIADAYMRRENRCHSIGATDLTSIAFEILATQRNLEAADRKRFLGAVAQTMRRVLIDRARKRIARGGGLVQSPLDSGIAGPDTAEPEHLIATLEAIGKLTELHPRQGEVASLYFILHVPQAVIAEQLGVDLRTVEKDWRFAKRFIRDEVMGVTHPA